MKFLDRDHPFFRNIWARWLTILLPLAWAGVELYTGNPGWALVFGAAGVWAAWELMWRR
jgi:hypothetical protein